MRYLLPIILFFFSQNLFAADISYVDTLNKGDPIWISEDGVTWHEGEFIRYNILPECPEVTPTIQDKDGNDFKTMNCSESPKYRHSVWYQDSFDGVTNYLTGRDPNRAPVSRAEIFGLQDRIKNILYADDLGSALGSIKALYEDRNRLIEVHETVRQQLKE